MKTKLRFIPLACAVILTSTGCAVQSPDYSRLLSDAAPQQWTASTLPAGRIAAWQDFWARWEDPVLVELITKALAANPDIETAATNLRAAHASVTSANAALWPTASLGLNGSRNHADGTGRNSVSAEVSGGLSLNLAGSEFWQADAATLKAMASAYTLEDVRAATAAATAEAYVNLRAAEASLAVTKASLETYLETAETAQWQFQAGTGSASEAEDALMQVASSRAQIPTLEKNIIQYRNALMRLTGCPVDELGLEPTGIIPVPPMGGAVSMPAELIEQRPDVRAAKATAEAAVKNLKSAKSDFFPTLSLSGNIGTTAAAVSALGASGTGVASLAAALAMPILNWGNLIAGEETAAANLQSAVASYRSTLLSALEETDNALTAIRSAEYRKGDLERAVSHARTAEKLARDEYGAGIGEYTMLLSTQRSLLSARESELNNRADRANSYITLYRALGGDWAVNQSADKTAAPTAAGK